MELQNPQPELKRVLSLDGGGIRGVITAAILVSLEEKLNIQYKAKFHKDPEKPIRLAQCFDFMAGTSTGGILATALLCPSEDDPTYPRYSAKEALDIYLKNGKAIFSPSWAGSIPLFKGLFGSKYGATNIEMVLEKYFGTLRLSNLLRPCLITSYDIKARKALFFTSHDANDEDGRKDFYLKDVTRSTSAAPTFFPPTQSKSLGGIMHSSIDGGLFANNPTMCAVIEASKLFGKGESLHNPAKMLIISIGTGTVEKPYEYEKAKAWGLLGWVQPIIDIMMSGVSETVDYQLKKLYETIGRKQQYIRIKPQLINADSEMDNVSDSNLEALVSDGNACALANDELLCTIAATLV